MKGICENCGLEKTIMSHHTNYISDEKVLLCRECHGKAHSDKNNKYHPINKKIESSKSSVVIVFRANPKLIKNLQDISPKHTISSVVKDAIDFYIKYHDNTLITSYNMESTLKLLEAYKKLVNELTR